MKLLWLKSYSRYIGDLLGASFFNKFALPVLGMSEIIARLQEFGNIPSFIDVVMTSWKSLPSIDQKVR